VTDHGCGVKPRIVRIGTHKDNLKCLCNTCITISKITPKNEWNRNRPVHYLYVLGKLVDELFNYIDSKRMELAVTKLTNSVILLLLT
jgi:hypothetical protein